MKITIRRGISLFLSISACTVSIFADKLHTDILPLQEAQPAQVLDARNNYSFPIRETVRFPIALPPGDGEAMAISQSVAGGAIEVHYIPVQVEEDEGRLYGAIDLQMRAGEQRQYQFERFSGSRDAGAFAPSIEDSFPSGLPSLIRLPNDEQIPLFDIGLLEISDNLEELPENREDRLRSALSEVSDAEFTLTFDEAGAVFRRLVFTSEVEGLNRYSIATTYTVSTAGHADISIEIEPIEIHTERAYLAIAKRIPAHNESSGLARWKGEIVEIEPGESSPERTTRSHSLGRDVNWFASQSDEEPASFALLSAFVPNLTRSHDDRYQMANDFFVNEFVLGDEEDWWLLSEIARENVLEEYVPRQFVVPAKEERLGLNFRALPEGTHSPEEIDQAFIAFAGYRGAFESDESLRLDFGVEGVSFGTSYLPHSAFGENFGHWRSGDLQGERWWPNFGRNWHHFKDEIRRDLRIANALGLEWIRIQHFDAPDFRESYLETEAGQWMLDYLEFISREANQAGLGLFLDLSLSPEDATLVAEQFGENIGYYEMQNKVLQLGAFQDRIDYWKSVRENIREARPNAPVFVSGGAQFFGLYNRLEDLGFSSDAVGQHAYVDDRKASTSVRDMAVSLGGFASERGRIPLNSHFNWRMITRESEHDQAQHFWNIANDLLSQRGVSLLFQSHFHETIAVSPRKRGALRHNELLRLDRTPKPQAWAYADLVRRYGKPDSRARLVNVALSPLQLEPGEEGTYQGQLTNLSSRTIDLTLTPELPAGISAMDNSPIQVSLGPRQTHRWQRTVQANSDFPPGYHHFFERIEFDEHIQFGWAAAIRTAAPQLNLERPLISQVRYAEGIEILQEASLHEIDWLVFGEEAPGVEVNWTLYLYNTLRAATGSPAQRTAHNDMDQEQRSSNLLLVGTPESNPLISEHLDELPVAPQDLPAGHGAIMLIPNPEDRDKRILIVTGKDSDGVDRAASDFVSRYWEYAKDAASFREGMPPVERGPSTSVGFGMVDEHDVLIIGPESSVTNDAIRFRTITASEPRAPASGIHLHANRNGETLNLGTTNESGELHVRFEEPGIYIIEAENAEAAGLEIELIDP